MKKQDARKLPPKAQEYLRRRVVKAIREGMKKTEAAQVFGVSRAAIYKWLGAYEDKGTRGLVSGKRGRPRQTRLDSTQRAQVKRLILDRCPDQLKLPFMLWTRKAVCDLLASRYDINISVWTAGRYLKSWGFTPQKPLRRAFERNPKAVRHWLDVEYPAIRKSAKREGAEIYWGDEMGMRSDHQTGTSYGLKGKTPVVSGTGQRFRCNMISAVNNRGKMGFMVFLERFTSAKFIEFLKRLVRHSDRKVYLVVDSHPVHLSAKVRKWVEANEDKMKLFFLPAYCPELNPDELLNQDVKSNALGRRRPRNRDEMIGNVRSYLWSTQKSPEIVRNYFKEIHVCYAA